MYVNRCHFGSSYSDWSTSWAYFRTMANLELPAADMSEYGAICLHCRPEWISRGWRCTQCSSGIEHSDAVQITLESISGRAEEIELPFNARVHSVECEVRRRWGVAEWQKIDLLCGEEHLHISDHLRRHLRITVVVNNYMIRGWHFYVASRDADRSFLYTLSPFLLWR